MTTTDHDILRIEGNIAVPKGDVDKAMAFFNSFIDEIYKHEGYSAALTITDAATSPHVLILKEELEGLRNRIERQRDAIAYLQEKEVKQDEAYQQLMNLCIKTDNAYEKLSDAHELLKAAADFWKKKSDLYDQLVISRSQAKIKPNVFKRIWKWFRSTVNQ